VDANGQALISLKAGERYYMQLEHVQQTGGYGGGVTYKYAGAPDPYSALGITTANATILSGSVIEALVPFTPSVSIALSNGVPVVTYYGVLWSGSTVDNITTKVGTSSGGPGYYTAPAGQVAQFFKASE
jgi:hypothetical protein